jgi:RNA polymerase sigma factor (sigma-70 family)
MKAILRNVIIDRRRASPKNRTFVIQSFDERLHDRPANGSPEDDASRAELPKLVWDAVESTLAEDEQKVIRLKFDGGLSHAQIARELHRSEDQIDRLIHRVLERLAPKLRRLL